jgi:hypothetical protein
LRLRQAEVSVIEGLYPTVEVAWNVLLRALLRLGLVSKTAPVDLQATEVGLKTRPTRTIACEDLYYWQVVR